MDSMEQCRNIIVDLVNQSGHISFAQLKKKFPQISEMTLRTDLIALDEAKQLITQKALKLIRKDTTRFIDSGSTATEPALHILRSAMNRYSMSACGRYHRFRR